MTFRTGQPKLKTQALKYSEGILMPPLASDKISLWWTEATGGIKNAFAKCGRLNF